MFLFLWHVKGDLIEKIRVTAEISVKIKTPSFPHSVCCRTISDWSQGGREPWRSHWIPQGQEEYTVDIWTPAFVTVEE